MRRTRSVVIHYPAKSSRVLVRTETDWDTVIAPVRVNGAKTRHEFRIPIEGAHAYFKPMLMRGAKELWARGENELVLANGAGARDVYPYFTEDDACSVRELHTVEGPARMHDVRVFVPPGYEENTLQYFPVLYLQDASNLFFQDEAFGGTAWKIDETLKILGAMNLTRPVIAVGVYPREREEDYTQPGYEEYGRFLVDEIVPWVNLNYRTLLLPETTAVMGSSLGGVVSLYLAWQFPEVFGRAACLSSTFGYKDDLAQRIGSEEKRAVRIYLDSGWPRDNYEATLDMRNLLVARGYSLGRDVFHLAFPNAKHDEAAWSMRAHVPIQLLFGSHTA